MGVGPPVASACPAPAGWCSRACASGCRPAQPPGPWRWARLPWGTWRRPPSPAELSVRSAEVGEPGGPGRAASCSVGTCGRRPWSMPRRCSSPPSLGKRLRARTLGIARAVVSSALAPPVPTPLFMGGEWPGPCERFDPIASTYLTRPGACFACPGSARGQASFSIEKPCQARFSCLS